MSSATTEGRGTWTAALKDRMSRTLPADQVLPDRQPAYVASWIYVFGVLTLAGLFVVVGSGIVLAMGGAAWWHTSSLGHFVNSVHLWSVELFFACMVIHLWGKFWMAAWRGHRGLTWVTGVVAFVTSIGAAFTGYLTQSNFSSQWISGEAKEIAVTSAIGSRVSAPKLVNMPKVDRVPRPSWPNGRLVRTALINSPRMA